MSGPYYVYALKDRTKSPALPFYVGRGTGVRAWEHLLVVDGSLKGWRIQAIRAAGAEVLVTVLLDDLSEAQALKVEAELIGSFGTIGNGGSLTNYVLPSGARPKGRRDVVVPSGAVDKVAVGLKLLMDAMLELARANPRGCHQLGFCEMPRPAKLIRRSSQGLSDLQPIGILMRQDKLARDESVGRGRYIVTTSL